MKRRNFMCTSAAISLIAALSLAAPAAWAASPTPDQAAIEKLLKGQFDKPESRLEVKPVVADGGHAVAGWAQGGRGGRALLAKHDGRWKIVLCAGDGLRKADMLVEAGVPAATAQRISTRLAAEEAKLPRDYVKQLAMFEGVLRMDASGAHPPAHGGHGASHGAGHGGAHPGGQKGGPHGGAQKGH